jgi:methylglutaconyl-CoA hydratase
LETATFTVHNISSIYLCCSISAQFGRGAKKDIRSATATTTEMVGKLNLRVLHGGAATLHSIKVMQPKQVSVKH